jgi:hypothetical protein
MHRTKHKTHRTPDVPWKPRCEKNQQRRGFIESSGPWAVFWELYNPPTLSHAVQKFPQQLLPRFLSCTSLLVRPSGLMYSPENSATKLLYCMSCCEACTALGKAVVWPSFIQKFQTVFVAFAQLLQPSNCPEDGCPVLHLLNCKTRPLSPALAPSFNSHAQ